MTQDRQASAPLALAAIVTCAVIWGTTWYAITWQLGAVAPVVSVVVRFALASVVLFAACLALRLPIRLNRAQHLACLGQGAFAFSISYAFVYAAETRVTSAIVAVIFAALAFLNLGLFRVAAGQKAAPQAWLGAGLGVIGVAVLSGGEVLGAGLDREALIGVGFAIVGVCAAAGGNYFAWRSQQAQAAIVPGTAWAMAYGAGLLALFALLTGVDWRIEWSLGYALSLIYLSLFGSVAAFLIYFWLARARGYALSSYVSALTPPLALLISVMFEGARFHPIALLGLALVVGGQLCLIRAPRVSAT